MSDGVGDLFQKETRYDRERANERPAMAARRPELYLNYPQARIVRLPPPCPPEPEPTLHEALKLRHSVRVYQARPVTTEQLSYLLWAAGGLQGTRDGLPVRTAPSAGALYPIETYLVVNDVVGLEQGVYHYAVRDHALEHVKAGSFGEPLVEATLGQSMCGSCPVVFAWTAVIDRCRVKYGQRAYRYIYLDAGHMAENLALAAAGSGLGTCQVGALYDGDVEKILGVDGSHEPILYLSTVGHPR